MLIDLINLAHNKPIIKNDINDDETIKGKNKNIFSIIGGITFASIIVLLLMVKLEKSSEKNYKFSEKPVEKTRVTPETFSRKSLKKATNRKFEPSISKSRLQERKIRRDTYIPKPQQKVVRPVKKRMPANKPEYTDSPGEVMGADGSPIPADPYQEDNYDDYSEMDKDPYYEDAPSEPNETEDPYLDNPYPD